MSERNGMHCCGTGLLPRNRGDELNSKTALLTVTVVAAVLLSSVVIADAEDVDAEISDTANISVLTGNSFEYIMTHGSDKRVKGMPDWVSLEKVKRINLEGYDVYVRGTPQTAGVFKFYLNTTMFTIDRVYFTITVRDPIPIVFDKADNLDVVEKHAFRFTPGTDIDTSITVTKKPSWISFSNGVLSGTAPDVDVPTIQTIELKATASVSNPAKTTMTFTVYPELTVTGEKRWDVLNDRTYSFLNANLPSKWTASGLPAGVSIDTRTGAVDFGETASGTYSFRVTVTSDDSIGQKVSVDIKANVFDANPMDVSDRYDVVGGETHDVALSVGQQYTFDPSSASIIGGSLKGPSWMSLRDGAIVGTPSSTGIFHISYTMKVGSSTVECGFAIWVFPIACETMAMNIDSSAYCMEALVIPGVVSVDMNDSPRGMTVSEHEGFIGMTWMNASNGAHIVNIVITTTYQVIDLTLTVNVSGA